METKAGQDNTIIEMFGLTNEQTQLMFSVQKLITNYDISLLENDKIAVIKNIEVKKMWQKNWENHIIEYLKSATNNQIDKLLDENELNDRFKLEIEKSPNRTWYYIVLLECLTFVPYTPLGDDLDKKYLRCHYNSKKCYLMLEDFFSSQEYITKEFIERFHTTYNKSINKISGKKSKITAEVLAVVAIGTTAAAIAAVAAGPIAVLLVGPQYAALHGAALTNACLALLGGGAIAAQGAGMIGGITVIAGGGALLGLAGGGTIVGVASSLLMSSPEFALTESAKLETILKEVIINAQKDVVLAQKLINQYKEQIKELNNKLTELEIENEKNKKEIKNIKLIIKYLKRSCKNMVEFTSAYKVGVDTEENINEGSK